MDGLECQEISLSETRANKDFRIDSPFFTTHVLHNPNLPYSLIGDCLLSTQYGISRDMNTDNIGYPIFRMNEIHHSLCDLQTAKYVSLSPMELVEFKLNNGDVVFNRTNSYELVGRTGVYYDNGMSQVFASYLVRLIPDKTKLRPEYLAAFLNTKYGVQEIRKRSRQSINQTNVNPEEVKAIQIPLLSENFQRQIEKLYLHSHSLRLAANQFYDDMERFLDKMLGLSILKGDYSGISCKSLSESFAVSGRLDAEYYQPKYDGYYTLIAAYPGGWSTVGKEFSHVNEKCTRTRKAYDYVEIGDVDVGMGIAAPNRIDTVDLPDNAKIITRKGDIIVSTVRPNRGAVAILADDNLLVSGAFTVLREVGSYKKEVLQALLRTELYRDWLLRYNVGTSYPVIKDSDVLNMPIPLLPDDLQNEIARKVQESFSLRRQSEKLIETAVRAVEIAIEQDEAAAVAWQKSVMDF